MDTKGRFVNHGKILAAGSAAALALGVAACGSSSGGSSGNSGSSASSSGGSSAPVTLNGAGSTFAAPFYQQWAANLKDHGLTLNYAAVGSGDGVAQLTQGQVDFAGSDPALKPEEAAAIKKSPPVQIPTGFGAVTESYNLPGVKGGLKLDAPTSAKIFEKKITKWNDPAIASQNPGVKLPSTKITVVHRSDSSGTTKAFTTFLAGGDPNFEKTIGVDKTVNWPSGTTGAKGNAGVAAAVKQTEGAIGYVEQAYALQNNFTYASIKNASGRFVAPSLQSVTAAGEGIKVPADLAFSIVNSPNPAAYPVASQTFAITYQDLCKAGVGKSAAQGVVKFLKYGLTNGQSVLKQLSYAPLPQAIDQKAMAVVNGLKCNGKAIA